MLSTRDIETKDFTRTRVSGGYKPEEVDAFLDQILVDYNSLLEERENLNRRIAALSEKLAQAQGEQDSWKNAILNTQKSYDEVIAAAQKKADKLVSEAQEYAKRLMETATETANRQQAETEKIAAQVDAFKNNLLAAYTEHIQLIRNIPAVEVAENHAEENMKLLQDIAEDAPFEVAAPVAAPVEEEPTIVMPVVEEVTYTDEVAPAATVQRRSDRYQTQRLDTSLETENDPFAEEEKPEYVNNNKMNGLFEEEDDEDDAPAKKGFFFGGGKKKKKPMKSFFQNDDDDDEDDDYDDEDDD